MTIRTRRSVRSLAAVAVLALVPAALGQSLTLTELCNRVWTDAQAGRGDLAATALRDIPAGADPTLLTLRESGELLQRSVAKRDQARDEQVADLSRQLDEALAGGQTPSDLSAALRSAVELLMLHPREEQAALVAQPRIAGLITAADAAARRSEAAGDWLLANELFFRLNLLLEERGTYRADVRRLGERLAMLRLYTPERFWQLRNDRRVAEGKSPLPPYNGLGEDYRAKLATISRPTVLAAVARAAEQHVNRARVPLAELLRGGLESTLTLATTRDLQAAFPTLADQAAGASFQAALHEQLASVPANADRRELVLTVERLLAANARTVRLPESALLHEFGNGAMSRLDDFSAIIWPDELARFERMTQGQFTGVGIQIQLDDETQFIKVVTPLEGTPAHRAGVRSGDFIKAIDDQSAVGITLDQAVELITGPANTGVRITFERDGADIAVDLVRDVIPIQTVKGWKRTGAGDHDWDWFIDPQRQIGYVRLLQFTDHTTRDLLAAVTAMKARGLSALIVDLRFNPGGLLTEAVSVANVFIDSGTIVSTEGAGARQDEVKSARPGRALLAGIPVAVLVNEGSASASEIVAGAIRHYAVLGQIDAVVVGDRTYGKGSVQNVWQLDARTAMKLTTQYYKLPDGQIIHREPGSSTWGVTPQDEVQMLPKQITDALSIRQEADVIVSGGQGGRPVELKRDPAELISAGVDLQLQRALFLLQCRTAPAQAANAGAPRRVAG